MRRCDLVNQICSLSSHSSGGISGDGFWCYCSMKDSTSCIISQTMQSHYNTWANHWRDAEIPEEPCRRDCRAGSKVESTSSSPIGTDDTESHKQSHTSSRCLLQSVKPSANTSLFNTSRSFLRVLQLSQLSDARWITSRWSRRSQQSATRSIPFSRTASALVHSPSNSAKSKPDAAFCRGAKLWVLMHRMSVPCLSSTGPHDGVSATKRGPHWKTRRLSRAMTVADCSSPGLLRRRGVRLAIGLFCSPRLDTTPRSAPMCAVRSCQCSNLLSACEVEVMVKRD